MNTTSLSNGSSKPMFTQDQCQNGPIPDGDEQQAMFQAFCRCNILPHPLLVEEIFSKFFLTVSVMGNLLVIIVLYRMKRGFFNAPMKALLQNLSIADTAVCVLYNVNDAVGVGSPLTTSGFCKLFGGLLWASLSSSSCAVCCVSIERYLAVVKPLEFNLTKKKALLMIIFSWYYSLLFTILDFYFLEKIVYKVCLRGDVAICGYSHLPDIDVTVLNLLNIIATFIIPLIIVLYTNVSIMAVMVKSAKAKKKNTTDQSNKHSGVIMIVFLLTAIYVICSVPFTVNYVLNAIPVVIDVPRQFTAVAYYLMLANSSCNPFIYSFFSAEFRRECANLISLPYNWIKDKING
ncbi:tachykinin-like peptides receptor 99D [Actinia tenebrosa]|uniref:Tachykinin-like peptides receptor 99D n=1 Tax=Actinia tenebrosa TaxID=6105 RepID=A0A6P8HT62_ACTTE|nr:tachykinin-like peptides receptor 99D [Actinia tenebrosa]